MASQASREEEGALSAYLEYCGIVPPKRLGSLLRVLQLQDMKLMEPPPQGSYGGYHPLVVPLAKDADDSVVGLLRWPTAKRSDDLPVVRACFQAPAALTLVAKSVPDYVMRAAAAADFAGTPCSSDIVDIANEGLPYEKQYERGSVKNFNKGLDRYLLLRVAAFPDTYESLARDHLDTRKDEQSALITAEKACDVFGDWASMHAFQARLLTLVPGYDLEARDSARAALSKPLWTLGCDIDEFRELVLLAGKESVSDFVTAYRKMAENERTSPDVLSGKIPPERAAIDAASRLMDLAVCDTFFSEEKHDWDSVRPKLGELYTASGSTSLARLVLGTEKQD